MFGIESLGVFFLGILLLVFIVNILFCLSLYSAIKLVPPEKQIFPAWLVWLMLIPFIGVIFTWIMEPFGLPKAFEQALADNNEAVAKTKTLFGLGLAHAILRTLVFLPFFQLIFVIASLVVWIIYWVKIVDFKNKYLLTLNVEKKQLTK